MYLGYNIVLKQKNLLRFIRKKMITDYGIEVVIG